jgi:predicted N-formylglutamate amidohydrolase
VIAAERSRLLIELNRSRHHRGLFSEFSAQLPVRQRSELIDNYYEPHREKVRHAVAAARPATAIHVAVHSFSPSLNGLTRRADIGLLYDPQRGTERSVCSAWIAAIARLEPTLRVRRNYPYRGTADGLTTALRREFDANTYAGIELEINQALSTGSAKIRARLASVIAESLIRALKQHAP